MASAQGTATIDFGATPASYATVSVTGQTFILSSSFCEAFIMGETTADHNENAHKQLAHSAKVVCGAPTVGVGFPIEVEVDGLVNGQFKIKWCWAD